MLISDEELIGKVSEIVRAFGCEALALGPPYPKARSIGHIYGPSVIVRSVRKTMSPREFSEMAALVTAKVPGITAVSMAR